MTPQARDVNSLHRGAKILVDLGLVKSWDAAIEQLSRYRFAVNLGADAAASVAGQHALLTIVNCGIRCCPGGVYVFGIPESQKSRSVLSDGGSLRDAVQTYGGKVLDGEPDGPDIPTIVLGDASGGNASLALRVTWGGWSGGVAPLTSETRLGEDETFPPASILAAALGVSEIFAALLGKDLMAGRRSLGMNLREADQLWTEPVSPLSLYLPKSLWLLGLGHLGQAYAWVAASLTYPEGDRPRFVLQDFDVVKESNLSTSIMSFSDNLGVLKTRVVSRWLESRGFATRLIERPFAGDLRVSRDEPRVLLAGLDNFVARRLLESAGVDLVVDVGLGALAADYDGICLQCFTTTGRAAKAFQEPKRSRPIQTRVRNLEAYKELGLDTCGMHLASDAAVGVPFVGVSAACLAIAEICTAVEGRSLPDTLALSLSDLPDVDSVSSGLFCRNPGFVKFE